MPCYIDQIQPPSREEYELWHKHGYFTGTYEEYELAKKSPGDIGGKIFICGDLGPHCSDCAGFGDFLCDYPVGEGKTCDRLMCEDHSHEIAPEIHYCEAHYRMWREFKDAGGVNESLKNVVAFKEEK